MPISEWCILSQSCIWVVVLVVKERMLRPLPNMPHSIVTRIVLLWNIHKVHTQPTETYIMMWFGQANWSSLISPMKKNCWMRFCVVNDADVSQCSLCGSRDVCSFPGWGAMAKGLRACFYISQFCTTWNTPLWTMGRCQTTSEITQTHQHFALLFYMLSVCHLLGGELLLYKSPSIELPDFVVCTCGPFTYTRIDRHR
jgi:hypothetical protein